jgi:hypothetical protein
MTNKTHPDQMLRDLARSAGPDLSHLPYSAEFERVCRLIKPNATSADMHRLWEKLLDINTMHALPTTNRIDSEKTPISMARPVPLPAVPPQPRISSPIQQNLPLFDAPDSIAGLQPWSATQESQLSPEQIERRQRILAGIADSRFGALEHRVADILKRFPETRDSDTALCIKYWKTYHADVLERWRPLELEVLFQLDRLETIGRIRRMIQNELRLFRGVESVRRARGAAQAEFHEYLVAHHASLPEIRFYLDETGNEGNKAYTGVAGVCIMNWKQFEKHHAALELWRSRQGWPETIHFSETGAGKMDRAVSLLQQLRSRRSGILFLGHSLSARGRTQEVLFSLFIQLIVDSLKYLRDWNCLARGHGVRVIKEAEPGFDALFKDKMTKQLGEVVAMEFPGELAVLPVETVTKGREVLLECADLIAGGMQRRALGKGRNPKDRLAEAVVNVTGFEDHEEPGAVFKHYPSSR